MTNDFNKFKALVSEMYKINKTGTEWINKLPIEINDVFFDNPYTVSMGRICDMLITEHFGEYSEDVFWLLYEFEEGKEYSLEINGKQHTISTLEDYFNAIKSTFK